MDKFHNHKTNHLIYAILWEDDGDEFAFIGKTTSTNTKALLRRHLRGEVSLTSFDLHRDDWDGKPPHLIVLHSLVCTGAEAYRYILCYIRLYEDFGFMTVAYSGTDEQAYDMFPYTEKLYKELQRTVTKDFLSNGITLEKPETKSVYIPEKEPKEQLNIRLDMHILSDFQRFCRQLGITQREGFLHLMRSANQDDLATDPLFVEQRATIERQKKRIEKLEEKLQSPSRGQKADARLKKTIANTKQFVTQYIAKVVEEPSSPLLKCQTRKGRTEVQHYKYPSTDGATTMELHALFYSRTKYSAIFVCGKDLSNGHPIMLRYYPNDNYIGITPRGKYCAKNARWLVSYQRAKDDAMELVAALPLPLCTANDGSEETPLPSDDLKWLDEVINEASMLNGSYT